MVRVSGDSHAAMLSLALGFGPQVLFLLQTFGHLQVLLHQTALVDVGCQVALDWKSKGRETRRLDIHFAPCLIQINDAKDISNSLRYVSEAHEWLSKSFIYIYISTDISDSHTDF